MWEAVVYNFADEEHYEKIKRICEEISSSDKSFKFKAEDADKKIVLSHEDKDTVARKAAWIIYKADMLSRLVFDLKER